MRALVTGGAGFIGSNLVDELIRLGHEVIVIDNESAFSSSKVHWNNSSENYKVDAANYDLTRHLYEGVDWVFNLAATARMQQSINNPLGVVKNNVDSVATVLQCSVEAKVSKVINSSTSSAYGDYSIGDNEDAPNNCLNGYSLSKAFGEDLLQIYSQLYGLTGYNLRYFNVYGPREPIEGHYATVVGKFIKQAKEEKPLTIVGDGAQVRNFTDVRDVVAANIAIAEANLDHKYNGTLFNVAGNDNLSIQELANSISTNQTYIPPRKGEHKYSKANTDKIKNVVGWEPRHKLSSWTTI